MGHLEAQYRLAQLIQEIMLAVGCQSPDGSLHQRQPLWPQWRLAVAPGLGRACPPKAVNLAPSKGTGLHLKDILSKI